MSEQGTRSALHDDVLRVLRTWPAPDAGQGELRSDIVRFVESRADATSRTCAAGHVTASGLVVDVERERVLLTLHPKVGRWLQLGGHLEADDTGLRAAALRECVEESGIERLSISAEPLRLDRHEVHCRPDLRTWHLDVQYVVVAPDGAVERRGEESDDLRWFDWSSLPSDVDAGLVALVRDARLSLVGGHGVLSADRVVRGGRVVRGDRV